MMSSEPSSLEGWVAIKEGIFQETKRIKCQSGKVNFYVNWNRETGQFSVTFTEHQRLKSDTVSCSYSTLITPFQLREIHNCLRNLSPNLDQWFPPGIVELTRNANGYKDYLWNVITSALGLESEEKNLLQFLEESELDKLRLQTGDYLTVAYDSCSHLTVMSCLFPEDFDFDEYFENLSELRHKAYLGRLDSARKRFAATMQTRNEHLRKQRLAKKGVTDSEWTFKSFAEDLTSSTETLLALLAEYYSYLKQPFLDLRECSLEKHRQAEKTLCSPDFGDRIKEELRKVMPRWKQEIRDGRESLRELEMEYFQSTTGALTEYKEALDKEAAWIKRLKDSSNGQDCWALCQTLLSDAELRLASEKISFWNSKRSQLKAEKQALYSEVLNLVAVTDAEELIRKLSRLESQIYGKQAKLLEARENVLTEQDKYWKLRLKNIKKTIEINCDDGLKDGEDTFFDAPESEMDLERMLGKCDDPRMSLIKESVLNANKQLATIRNLKKKIQSQKLKGTFLKSLASQEGNTELKEILEKKGSSMKEQRTEKVKKERGDTLQRIRDYRTKNTVVLPRKKLPPNRSLIKPTPKTLGSPTKPCSEAKNCSSQNHSIAGSISTETQKNANSELSQISQREADSADQQSVTAETANLPLASEKSVNQELYMVKTLPPPPPPPPPPLPVHFLVPPPPPVAVQKRTLSAKQEAKSTLSSMDSVLDAIRAGVKLRKVKADEGKATDSSEPVRTSRVVSQNLEGGGNPLMKALEEKLKSVRKAMEDESDQDDEECDNEFDD